MRGRASLPGSTMMPLLRFLRSFSTQQYLVIAGVWTTGILVALSIPSPNLPEIDPSLTLDKVAHLVLFAGLAVFWMRALRPSDASPSDASASDGASGDGASAGCSAPPRPWTRAVGVFAAGVVFAVGSEFYQKILPFKRTADPYDAIADIVGLILGLSAYLFYRRFSTQANPAPHKTEPS